MADSDGRIGWYSPNPRGVFEFDRFRIPRSLRKLIRRGVFEVRIDTTFESVMRACADRPEGSWISEQIIDLYTRLHDAGFAHSVEAWHDGELAGGLYGVVIGGAFFGESMFHRRTDASKVALAALIERLEQRNFALIDTQWITPHLASLGAVEIPRGEYLERLASAIRLDCRFSDDREPAADQLEA